MKNRSTVFAYIQMSQMHVEYIKAHHDQSVNLSFSSFKSRSFHVLVLFLGMTVSVHVSMSGHCHFTISDTKAYSDLAFFYPATKWREHIHQGLYSIAVVAHMICVCCMSVCVFVFVCCMSVHVCLCVAWVCVCVCVYACVCTYTGIRKHCQMKWELY